MTATTRATPTSLAAAILVEGLRVVRGGREVLRELSLEVPAGRITGLLGPSGCGKTTLMRSVVGVQRVAGGRVTVLGLPAGSPALRRRVAYDTQEVSLYADLTARENLDFFGAVLGVDRAGREEALARASAAELAPRVVGTLSGGQRARVSLATALLGAPEVVVLDEPTVGLDPVLRRTLWKAFHGLAASGVALLVSSHVMDEAAHCDELVLMRDGEVLAAGEPAALVARTGAADVEAAFLRLVGERG